MLFNPIIAMLHNSSANRWHPIVFEEKPLPGHPENLIRHKSSMHHTEGFASCEDAKIHARNRLAPMFDNTRLELETTFDWNGEGIPAIVHFFR